MKFFFLAFVILMISAKSATSQTIYKISHPIDLENHAYVDSAGVLIIPFSKYYNGPDTITDSTIGILWYMKGKGPGGFWAVNNKGQELFQVVHKDGPDEVHGGLIRIYGKDNLMGFANMKGEIVISPQFVFASPFYDEIIATFCEGCPSNFFKTISKDRVLEKEETKISKMKPKFGAIDRQGKVVIEPTNANRYEELKKEYLSRENKRLIK